MKTREAGILFPIFSLASRFGIGSLSREAYEFVDFLERSGQGYWQILPVGPTGYGNSPYQPVSSFAGNPYFISIEELIEQGLLEWSDVEGVDFGSNPESVDYGALYENRMPILKKAYGNFKALKKKEELPEDKREVLDELEKDFLEYKKKEEYWLLDYALYKAIKEKEEQKSWQEWEDGLRLRKPEALAEVREACSDEIECTCFLQFIFDRQWKRLKKYANSKNVKIIGDLPLYVAMDSADSWSHPETFLMDEDRRPQLVTGCPPDAFSPTGQLWGNPAYDWESMKKDGFTWWVERIRRNYEWYDVIRLDHFHGFCEYYGIPAEDETAENGKQYPGPGMELFTALKKALGDIDMIAEDLGNNTEENAKLLADSGFPGMNVLQYGFTSWDSIYVNHRHTKNSVVYTGTHDNTPTRAWAEEINEGERDFTRRYINSINTDFGAFTWDIIREAFRSVADLCIIPLQDYLCKGREARINTPGTAEGNWQWRLLPDYLSDDLAGSIRLMTETYSRIPPAPEAIPR